MALTLANAIGWNDSTIVLSGGTIRADTQYLEVDSEELLISGPLGNASQIAGSVIPVVRAANGTQATPHSQGASVTPLFPVLSATAGVVYTP